MKALYYALLLIFPAILPPLAMFLGQARGPFYLAANSDPEYNYLFNSLSLLSLHVPQHTDHPGTTLQEIGAVVILAEWSPRFVAGKRSGLIRDVLSDPESYLRGINLILVLIVAGAVFWAGLALFRATESVFPALVLQGGVFLFYDLVYALTRVSPEPLLIATTFALIAILVPRLMLKPAEPAAAAGVIFGFGLVTKITFAPWGVILALFRGWRLKFRFAIAAAVSAALFLLPIVPRLPVVASWVISLAIHADRYGSGPVGLPAAAQWASRSRDLFSFQPYLFVWPLYYVVVFAVITFQNREDPRLRATKNVLILGGVILAIQLVITLKHYATHYMVPGLVAIALVNAFVALTLSTNALPTGQRALLGVVGTAIFIGALINTKGILLYRIGEGRANQAAARQLAQKRAQLGDCVAIGYYRSSLPGFALNFGSEYSGGVHGGVLKEIYSDEIMYNRFGGGFWSYSMEPRLEALEKILAQGRCVLMQGTTEAGGPPNLPESIVSTLIVAVHDEGLYRLSVSTVSR